MKRSVIQLSLLLLFLPTLTFCEPVLLAKYIITDARHNGEDATKEYLDQGGHIVFLENEQDQLSMANIRSIAKTYSYGEMYNVEFDSEPATAEHYETELFAFVWSYTNSYDSKEGTAQVQIIKVYKPQGTVFRMTMILENLDQLVYTGYLEGSINFKKEAKPTATDHQQEVNNVLPVAKNIRNDLSPEYDNGKSSQLTTSNYSNCEKIPLTIENLFLLVEYSIPEFGQTLAQYDYVRSTNQERVGQYRDGKYTTQCNTSLIDRFDNQQGHQLIYVTSEKRLASTLKEELAALEEYYTGMEDGFKKYAILFLDQAYYISVKYGENIIVKITKQK